MSHSDDRPDGGAANPVLPLTRRPADDTAGLGLLPGYTDSRYRYPPERARLSELHRSYHGQSEMPDPVGTSCGVCTSSGSYEAARRLGCRVGRRQLTWTGQARPGGGGGRPSPLPAGQRLPACLSVCLFACLPACLPARQPVCLSGLSVCLSVCLSSVCLSACLLVCISISLSVASLPVCLSACLSVCLPACLPASVCMSVYLSVCLPFFPSACLSACRTADGRVGTAYRGSREKRAHDMAGCLSVPRWTGQSGTIGCWEKTAAPYPRSTQQRQRLRNRQWLRRGEVRDGHLSGNWRRKGHSQSGELSCRMKMFRLGTIYPPIRVQNGMQPLQGRSVMLIMIA